ncbi:MAG: hypothetical protein ACYDDF_04515 [Thermoplasmatota archaeon]
MKLSGIIPVACMLVATGITAAALVVKVGSFEAKAKAVSDGALRQVQGLIGHMGGASGNGTNGWNGSLFGNGSAAAGSDSFGTAGSNQSS